MYTALADETLVNQAFEQVSSKLKKHFVERLPIISNSGLENFDSPHSPNLL